MKSFGITTGNEAFHPARMCTPEFTRDPTISSNQCSDEGRHQNAGRLFQQGIQSCSVSEKDACYVPRISTNAFVGKDVREDSRLPPLRMQRLDKGALTNGIRARTGSLRAVRARRSRTSTPARQDTSSPCKYPIEAVPFKDPSSVHSPRSHVSSSSSVFAHSATSPTEQHLVRCRKRSDREQGEGIDGKGVNHASRSVSL